MSAVVRKILIKREAVERAFQTGEKPPIRVARGITDDFRLFNVEMRGENVLFWFCGPTDGATEVVDDSTPIMTPIVEAVMRGGE